jgi:nucleoside-diphosphate-sugar epimerase/predicted dehydrogenase
VIVGLADSNREALQQMAERFQVAATYTDAAELLRRERPDVVHVLTPPQSHHALAKMAMEAGCHVYVEKPVCVSAEEAEDLARVAKRLDRRLCVGHCHLFDGVMRRARRLVEQGAIGAVCGIDSFYGFDQDPKYFKQGASHWAYRLPGGLIQNRIDHPLSVVLPFLREPLSVAARAVEVEGAMPPGIPGEVRILLDDGRCLATVVLSMAASPRFHSLTLYGTQGTLTVDFLNKRLSRSAHIPKVPKPISRALLNVREGLAILGTTLGNVVNVLTGSFHPVEGLPVLIQEFYRAIEAGRPAPVGPEDGLRAMRIMDQVWAQLEGQVRRGTGGLTQPLVRRPRILVTGGTGFIGTHLVRALCADGEGPVRVLVRDMRKAWRLKGLPVEIVSGDLSDARALRSALEGVSVVYHLAATMGGRWDDYVEGTVRGTERLIDAALAARVERFVYTSSIAVYGVPRGVRGPVTEEAPYPTRDLTPYIRSKIEAEQIILEAARTKGLPATILRPGVVYGPGGKAGLSRIGYPIGRWFVIVGLNDIELPLVYVGNVVKALRLAARSGRSVGQVYNVVDDAGITQTGYLDRLSRHSGARYRYVFFPYVLASTVGVMARAAGRFHPLAGKVASLLSPFHLRSCVTPLRYDTAKIQRDLGWHPEQDHVDERVRSLAASLT